MSIFKRKRKYNTFYPINTGNEQYKAEILKPELELVDTTIRLPEMSSELKYEASKLYFWDTVNKYNNLNGELGIAKEINPLMGDAGTRTYGDDYGISVGKSGINYVVKKQYDDKGNLIGGTPVYRQDGMLEAGDKVLKEAQHKRYTTKNILNASLLELALMTRDKEQYNLLIQDLLPTKEDIAEKGESFFNNAYAAIKKLELVNELYGNMSDLEFTSFYRTNVPKMSKEEFFNNNDVISDAKLDIGRHFGGNLNQRLEELYLDHLKGNYFPGERIQGSVEATEKFRNYTKAGITAAVAGATGVGAIGGWLVRLIPWLAGDYILLKTLNYSAGNHELLVTLVDANGKTYSVKLLLDKYGNYVNAPTEIKNNEGKSVKVSKIIDKQGKEINKSNLFANNGYVRAAGSAVGITGGNLFGNVGKNLFKGSLKYGTRYIPKTASLQFLKLLPLAIDQTVQIGTGSALSNNFRENDYYGVQNPYLRTGMDTAAFAVTGGMYNHAKNYVGNSLVKHNIDMLIKSLKFPQNYFKYLPESRVFGSNYLGSIVQTVPFGIAAEGATVLNENGVDTSNPLIVPALAAITGKYGKSLTSKTNNFSGRVFETFLRGFDELKLKSGVRISIKKVMSNFPEAWKYWTTGDLKHLDNLFKVNPDNLKGSLYAGNVNVAYSTSANGRKITHFNSQVETSPDDFVYLYTHPEELHTTNSRNSKEGYTFHPFRNLENAKLVFGENYEWYKKNRPEILRTVNSGWVEVGTGDNINTARLQRVVKPEISLTSIGEHDADGYMSTYSNNSNYNAIDTGGHHHIFYRGSDGKIYMRNADVFKFTQKEKGGGGYISKYAKPLTFLQKLKSNTFGWFTDKASSSSTAPVFISEKPAQVQATDIIKLAKKTKGERGAGKLKGKEKYAERFSRLILPTFIEIVESNNIQYSDQRRAIQETISRLKRNKFINKSELEDLLQRFNNARINSLKGNFDHVLYRELMNEGLVDSSILEQCTARGPKNIKVIESHKLSKASGVIRSAIPDIIFSTTTGQLKQTLSSHDLTVLSQKYKNAKRAMPQLLFDQLPQKVQKLIINFNQKSANKIFIK